MLAGGQSALRRIATLVADGAPPADVLAAVATEAHDLLAGDYTALQRIDSDGMVTVLAVHGSRSDDGRWSGSRWSPGRDAPGAAELRAGRAARVDDPGDIGGTLADVVREEGLKAWVAAPITTDGRVRGVLVVGSRQGPLPGDTESRIAEFVDIAGTAISNAESRAELASSRARVVAAADEARRRIERDLHDGTQQRLISLALRLRATEAQVPAELAEVREESRARRTASPGPSRTCRRSRGASTRRSSPRGGLGPALRELARRTAVPVEVEVHGELALPSAVEVAAYYVVSEALTNAAKHSGASAAASTSAPTTGDRRSPPRRRRRGRRPRPRLGPRRACGDRVTALGGTLEISSPPGEGTALVAALPVNGASSS